LSIVNTNRFDRYAARRLENRLGVAGVNRMRIVDGGIGRLLDSAFPIGRTAGDETAKEFAGLLVAIDEAMTELEAVRPANPLQETRAPRRTAERARAADMFRRTKPWEREHRIALAEFDRIITSWTGPSTGKR
jgi:hypothetical protein